MDNKNDSALDMSNGNSSNNELDKMFAPSGEANDIGQDTDNIGVENKSSEKVLVKTAMPSDESGYGSVLGVILVIISISFILAALFIKIMI